MLYIVINVIKAPGREGVCGQAKKAGDNLISNKNRYDDENAGDKLMQRPKSSKHKIIIRAQPVYSPGPGEVPECLPKYCTRALWKPLHNFFPSNGSFIIPLPRKGKFQCFQLQRNLLIGSSSKVIKKINHL